jgi:hypothetical protein
MSTTWRALLLRPWWHIGPSTLATRRDIAPGEELTIDYATQTANFVARISRQPRVVSFLYGVTALALGILVALVKSILAEH